MAPRDQYHHRIKVTSQDYPPTHPIHKHIAIYSMYSMYTVHKNIQYVRDVGIVWGLVKE